MLYLQLKNKSFQKSSIDIWGKDKKFEDMGASFLDVDKDGDLDLYVASGGNEFEEDSPLLQDRLYLNNSGKFTNAQTRLPTMVSSNSCVVPGDFDKDGDLDLFVGGRLVPGQYPLPAKSTILENQNGKFKDVTNQVAPFLNKAGMVTAASWCDFSGDGNLDLVVVGEWMPIVLLENQNGQKLQKINLLRYTAKILMRMVNETLY